MRVCLARAAELCRKALESPTCSCSHMRRWAEPTGSVYCKGRGFEYQKSTLYSAYTHRCKGKTKFNILNIHDANLTSIRQISCLIFQVVVACSAILCDNPSSDADLIRMDAKITNSCSHMWALAEKEQPLSPKDKKKIQHKVDYNRARIRQAHIQCAQSLQDVDGLYKKIKAAMLW